MEQEKRESQRKEKTIASYLFERKDFSFLLKAKQMSFLDHYSKGLYYSLCI